jgi:hypothetical protein
MSMSKVAGAAGLACVVARGAGKAFSRAGANVSLILFAITALAAALLVSVAPFTRARAATASSGALDPRGLTGLSKVWSGAALTNVNPLTAESACQEGVNCDTFKLTLTGTPADWSGRLAHVRISWTSPSFDYALSIHKGTNAGPVVASSDNPINSPRNWEETNIDPSTMGTGDFSVHVIYFTTSTADPYRGSATLVPKAATAPAAGTSTETPPAYGVYTPPAGFQQFDAGEPSIGSNWKTGSVFFQSSLQTMRVKFDDTVSPTRATWEDVSALTTSLTSLDPILYTDSRTGRVFSSQLAGVTSLTAYSDDDGATWTPSQGAGVPASVDHQTLGGGPFAAPLTRDGSLPLLYQNAVYYCSQDVGYDASCAVSLDGGQTFGPAVRIYTFLDCEAGLHGHVKVAPDGTAYVPTKACGGQQSVVVSENNGLTWSIRKVPGSSAGETDPSVGVGADGTVYFAYSNGDGSARAAVSHDRGQTWTNARDIGASAGVLSSVFPSAVAGDANRASVFFLGSSTAGTGSTGGDPGGFVGAWYTYIATTYDGGNTWTLVNATPNDPVQRGPVCLQGTLGCSGNTRNLLDFNDLTVDKTGRVLAALADGCVTDACKSGVDKNNDGRLDGNDNDGGAVATIIRQASGKGLFAQYDGQ